MSGIDNIAKTVSSSVASSTKTSTNNFGSDVSRTGTNGQAQGKNYAFSQAVLSVLADMPQEEKIPLGHQIEDFILDCEFNGYTCNAR